MYKLHRDKRKREKRKSGYQTRDLSFRRQVLYSYTFTIAVVLDRENCCVMPMFV